MTNIEHLRKLLQPVCNEEIIEFLEAVEDEIKELQKEKDDLETEVKDQPSLTTVNLGLDTLHYHLENGNLLIRQRLDNALREINQIDHSEIMF